jgi:hypothetical protein
MPFTPQARRIPLSRRPHIIGFHSLSTGAIRHESVLELDFVTLISVLGHSSAIIRFQPGSVGFEARGLRRCYTPELGLRRAECTELVEVKYEKDLRVHQEDFARSEQGGSWPSWMAGGGGSHAGASRG